MIRAEFGDYIEQAGVDELRMLNRLIIERLRFLTEEEARKGARAYLIGDAVEFEDRKGHWMQGRIVRINRKTVSVETEAGPWRVHPKFLRPNLDLGSRQREATGLPRLLDARGERLGEPGFVSKSSRKSVGREHDRAETSRNASCPCGSGKKYKRCCGS